jgi:hypothetical protein
MIYRSMQLKQEPQFTFVEKMFVSNKLQHRFIGHTILLAKDLGVILLALTAVGALGGILYLLLWLIAAAFKYVYSYLVVNHSYTTAEAMSVMLLGICGIAVVGCIIKVVVEAIKFNSQKMKATINHKLNQQNEEDDGS